MSSQIIRDTDYNSKSETIKENHLFGQIKKTYIPFISLNIMIYIL
jgi:hypothetical protein